jgi:hypothetical protein
MTFLDILLISVGLGVAAMIAWEAIDRAIFRRYRSGARSAQRQRDKADHPVNRGRTKPQSARPVASGDWADRDTAKLPSNADLYRMVWGSDWKRAGRIARIIARHEHRRWYWRAIWWVQGRCGR